MKVALVHKRFDLRGGTERVLYRTAVGLRDRGHEVHLFCGEFPVPPPAGIAAHRVPYVPRPRTARLLSFALLAPKAAARHRCDRVLSFDRVIQQDIFRSGGGPHRVFIQKMSEEGGPGRRLWYFLSPYHRCVLAIERRQISNGSRRIIAVCEQVKREMIQAYGIPQEKVVVIHNGVDHERFHPRRRLQGESAVRKKLGIPGDRPVVLFVGTGFRRKGLDRLLHLWDGAEFEGIYLLIVGDDARLSYYRGRWRRAEILFAGPQPQVEDYYAAADLLVLPSIQEAFGNVVLEAMASGLPVITVSGVGALDQVEDDLRGGILDHPDDPRELKDRLLRFLDRERWPVLSRAARRTAEKYSWENYFSQLERELREVARR